MNDSKRKDIEERTFRFSLRIIKMFTSLPRGIISDVIGKQIIRSGTSIGANIAEAQGALSKKEFIYQINIAKREARETLYWLRIISESELIKKDKLIDLMDECNQLVGILITIVKKSQKKS